MCVVSGLLNNYILPILTEIPSCLRIILDVSFCREALTRFAGFFLSLD